MMLSGTHLIEELLGVAKNSKQAQGSKVFRRPERSMAMMLATEVPSKRHHYEMVESDMPLPRKSARLNHESFGKVPMRPSVDLSGIATTAAKAIYFSRKAENVGHPIADLALQRFCHEFHLWHKLSSASLGCFCDCNPFVFRRLEGEAGMTFAWHVGLGHFPGSAAMVWPVELVPVLGYDDCFAIDFQNLCKQPSLLPILDWNPIVARAFAWRSVAWQHTRLPLAPRAWRSQVRAIVETSRDRPLANIAADQAWWKLDVSALKDVAKNLGIAVPGQASLMDTLLCMTKAVLGIQEEEAMALLGSRLVALKSDAPVVEELLEMDEASRLLTREDEQELAKEQKRQRAEQEAHDEFAESFKEVKRRHRAAEEKKKTGKAGDAKKNKKAKQETLPPADVLDHSVAKKFAPPGSYVWRAFSAEAWQGRLPPWGTLHRGWHRAGSSNAALRQVLVGLWKQYCTAEGFPPQECPMLGVFDRDVATEPGSRPGSSHERVSRTGS